MSDDFSDFEEDEVDENINFTAASNFLQKNVDKIDQNNLLEFYGLFKQGTIGKCNIPKPGMFNLQAKAKWNAWNKLGDMLKSTAMDLYVEKMKEIFKDEFEVEVSCEQNQKSKADQWIAVSCFQTADDDSEIPESEKGIFDYVKESNLIKLQLILESNNKKIDLNELDDSGMGLIHWASDRGDSNILEILLKHGANINLQDSDGQTALHYAASCGNMDCLKILLINNADRMVKDNDHMTYLDVAMDESILKFVEN